MLPPEKSHIRHSLAQLWDLLTSRDRFRLLGLLGILLIAALLEMVGIGMIPVFVSTVADPARVLAQPFPGDVLRALNITTPQALMIGGGIALVIVFLVKTGFTWFSVTLQNRFLLNLRVRLSVRLFRAYMTAPYEFHLARNPADLMRNTTIEVMRAINSMIAPLLRMLAQGLIGLAIFALLMVMQPLVSLLGISLFGAASYLFLRLIREHSLTHGREAQRHRGQQIKAVNQGLGGFKEARILGREKPFVAAYATSTRRLSEAASHQGITNELTTPMLELVAVVGLLVVVVLLLLIGLETQHIVPTLALFAIALLRLKQVVTKVVGTVNKLRYEHYAINPVYDDLRQLACVERTSTVTASERRLPFRQAIQVLNVSYRYPNSERPALDRISLTIPRGAAVAFVGATGAGKSTLADALLGLLPPESGAVRVDGQDIHEDLRAWQADIGYIPQSLYLLDDTLRRNIAFGLPDAAIDETRVRKVVRMAQLDEMLAQLPQGLDTWVGDRGVRLSGGQRQRICIARALYHDPAVLILDEATSALDNYTERRIVDELEAHRGDRTLIVVAHRLTTVQHCERLYLLHHGRIEATGSYDELLNTNPQFQRLAG